MMQSLYCTLSLQRQNDVPFDQDRARSTSKSIQGEFNPTSCQHHKQKVNVNDRKANVFIAERLWLRDVLGPLEEALAI